MKVGGDRRSENADNDKGSEVSGGAIRVSLNPLALYITGLA